MDWLFGDPKKQAKQQMRQTSRGIRRANRRVDRSRRKLEKQEEQLRKDLSSSTKPTRFDERDVRRRVTDLTRVRRNIGKHDRLKQRNTVMLDKVEQLKDTTDVIESMEASTKALTGINRTLDVGHTRRMMVAYERQTAVLDSKQDMMEEALDASDDDEEDELVETSAEEIFQQIAEEHRLEQLGKVLDAPRAEQKTRERVIRLPPQQE